MTRIKTLLFAAALTLNACATAGPIAVKCGLQDIAIAAADYAQIAADVHAKNWDDLAKLGDSLGWATLDCVLGDQVAQNPSVKPNVDEFKRLKSVEFRAAGVSACNSDHEEAVRQQRLMDAAAKLRAEMKLPPVLTCSATSPLVNSCPSGSVYYGSRDGQTGCFDSGWKWLGPAQPAPCHPTASLGNVRSAEAALLNNRTAGQLSSVELTEYFALLQIEAVFVSKELSLVATRRPAGARL